MMYAQCVLNYTEGVHFYGSAINSSGGDMNVDKLPVLNWVHITGNTHMVGQCDQLPKLV